MNAPEIADIDFCMAEIFCPVVCGGALLMGAGMAVAILI